MITFCCICELIYRYFSGSLKESRYEIAKSLMSIAIVEGLGLAIAFTAGRYP